MSNSYFKNKRAKSILLEHYDAKIKSLDFKIHSKILKTSFGNTNLLHTLNSHKPAMLLLHGLDACAPLILEQFSFLTEHYQLFAIDILGQPNKSEEIRLSKKNEDYIFWMNEITSQLSLSEVSLLGYSFGAFIGLKTALGCNFKITNLFLFSPAGFVNGNTTAILSKLIFPFLYYKISKQEQYLIKGLNSIYTDVNEEKINFMKNILLNYKSDTSYTPLLKVQELSNIKSKITIFTGEEDIFFPAQKLAKVQSKNSKINIVKLKNAKHVLGALQLKEVASYFETTPIN